MNMSEKESGDWYILFTSFRAEREVKAQLDAASIVNYLPMKTIQVRWQSVEKKIHVPVISRCVFVRLSGEEFKTLASISSSLLPTNFSDCNLLAQQMENIRILFREGNL